ncbi:hypothetical protein KJZ99_08670 [bacterium]|nr:hypothetical protein [bacterium]
MRFPILLLILLVCTPFAFSAEIDRLSYAEVQLGFATTTGLTVYKDVEGERVAPGSIGTTLQFSGYFPLIGVLSFSPHFTLLTTDGRVTDDPSPPPSFDVRFHQRELGLDLLFRPGDLRKLRLGAGSSIAWWTAAEDNARPVIDGEYLRGRSIDGQALMGRGVIHLALRNPEVSGASLKLVAAWPLANLIRVENTAATGYIGLQCGFSMILN